MQPSPNDSRTRSRLIFVYAVDGGSVSSIVNYVHKMVSPGTYRCNMCALTYGTFGTKTEWTRFIASLPHEAVFLHRDELAERYPGFEPPLPAVFIERDSGLSIVVDAAAMTRPKTIDQLIAMIRKHVDALALDSVTTAPPSRGADREA